MPNFDLTADPPRSPDESRRRLLAADPFPPLSPPTLDPPTDPAADLELTMPPQGVAAVTLAFAAERPSTGPPA